jgi:hypothetical protein
VLWLIQIVEILEEVDNELENFQIGSDMWEDKVVIFLIS